MAASIFKVKQLTEGVYALGNCFVNAYLIVGKDKALLFDNGYGFGDMKSAIRSITDLDYDVVLSHGHFDHAGGCGDFLGPICIHEKEVPVARRHLTPDYRKIALAAGKTVQKFLFWRCVIPKGIDEAAYIACGCYDRWAFVKAGDTFELGGTTLEVVELPGHTEGSIGLLCKEKRILLVGDAIGPSPWLHLPESTSLQTYVNMLKKTKELEFDQYLMAHRAVLAPKSDLDAYLAVAEDPDWENGKVQKKAIYSSDAQARQCWRKGTRKGPSIVISEDKL